MVLSFVNQVYSEITCQTGKGKDMGYTPRGKVGDNGEVRGGFVGGGVGIKGGSGKGIAFVDASKHTLSDTFEVDSFFLLQNTLVSRTIILNMGRLIDKQGKCKAKRRVIFFRDPKTPSPQVPQKYVGLLVGKQGEAIRRFRQYAAERDMAIRVNQDDNGAAASVVITGNDMDDIVALKADMTQNLFQAIAKLDANGPKGGDHKGYGKKGKGKGKMNNYHHHKGYFHAAACFTYFFSAINSLYVAASQSVSFGNYVQQGMRLFEHHGSRET